MSSFHLHSDLKIKIKKMFKAFKYLKAEFNKSGGPAGHHVRILWGPAKIYTVPVRMSDTIFLQYLVNISCFPHQAGLEWL